MIGEITFAFMAGAIATVNPCGFALLPAYFARRLGVHTADALKSTQWIGRTLAVGASATLGVLLIFGIAGGAIALGAYWIADTFPWAGFAVGIAFDL